MSNHAHRKIEGGGAQRRREYCSCLSCRPHGYVNCSHLCMYNSSSPKQSSPKSHRRRRAAPPGVAVCSTDLIAIHVLEDTTHVHLQYGTDIVTYRLSYLCNFIPASGPSSPSPKKSSSRCTQMYRSPVAFPYQEHSDSSIQNRSRDCNASSVVD